LHRSLVPSSIGGDALNFEVRALGALGFLFTGPGKNAIISGS
jgi:hypothetical protein